MSSDILLEYQLLSSIYTISKSKLFHPEDLHSYIFKMAIDDHMVQKILENRIHDSLIPETKGGVFARETKDHSQVGS